MLLQRLVGLFQRSLQPRVKRLDPSLRPGLWEILDEGDSFCAAMAIINGPCAGRIGRILTDQSWSPPLPSVAPALCRLCLAPSMGTGWLSWPKGKAPHGSKWCFLSLPIDLIMGHLRFSRGVVAGS